MTFRSDLDALTARKAALDAEVEAKARERDEAARMLEDLEARTRLPVLPDIRVASPCSEDWAVMTGDERVRHCGRCDKQVYNLSAMTRDEAESLVRERNGDLCARYYQRKDGTILLADCEVGRAAQRRKTRYIAAGLAATLGGAGAYVTYDWLRIVDDRTNPRDIDRHDDRYIEQGLMVTAPDRVPGDPSPRPSTGIPDCDGYRDALFALVACESVPIETRNAVVAAYDQDAEAWARLPPDEIPAVARACKQVAEMLREAKPAACREPDRTKR